MANHTRIPIRERFESKYYPEPNSGCWLWDAHCAKNGYGLIGGGGTGGGMKLAHRVSYELYVGPIPDGMNVLHKCDTPCCVNPDHLRLGTLSDNMQDMIDKRRQKKPTVNNLPLGVIRLPDYVKCKKRFYARARFEGVAKTSRYYETPEEAHLAYLEIRKQLRSGGLTC
jgi:hypothetical protein